MGSCHTDWPKSMKYEAHMGLYCNIFTISSLYVLVLLEFVFCQLTCCQVAMALWVRIGKIKTEIVLTLVKLCYLIFVICF